MLVERRQIAIDGGQTVSAVIAWPDPAVRRSTAVILAHGAGNDMHGAFLSHVHQGIATHGYAAVKFNFPYKERGARAPDPPAVLEDCYARVLATIRDDPRIGLRRVVIGGKSLGGRIASHLAARAERVDGLMLLGYPLHPAGKPDKLRASHLDKIRVPMLFFAGTRDPLCTLDLLRQTLARLPAPIRLHIIEGGDHSFSVPKSMRRATTAVWDEIVEVGVRWLKRLPQ